MKIGYTYFYSNSKDLSRTSFVVPDFTYEHPMVIQRLEHGRRDRNHHGSCWNVSKPHRQKSCHSHEAERDPK